MNLETQIRTVLNAMHARGYEVTISDDLIRFAYTIRIEKRGAVAPGLSKFVEFHMGHAALIGVDHLGPIREVLRTAVRLLDRVDLVENEDDYVLLKSSGILPQ
jgi:hypothetical protein